MIYDDKAINRLKRAEGQIKGILRMIEEGKECKEVITQLSAARSAIDRTIAVIVSSNLEHCIRESMEAGNEDSSKLVEEAVNMLVKSR
ncbi:MULTISPECIES: metal-sensitive transcriptional regulator [Bacillaceae]|uniref:metal-sensitive transcriptional regulator n=1 Tax=Bacillaceae TaxID=186817 RepID=UPI0027DF078A|nr:MULTISPECIES: metal-sensitive transcriptional regulator [Bacillaceae]MDR6122881.1 DNA-binding FrmR family transcriptional regulator [Bacillus sp. SLBN-46]WML60210.1 metal-sensitive transcriptional regulator [Neobacillus sp. PS2-9]